MAERAAARLIDFANLDLMFISPIKVVGGRH
jgi:hypothetical protein